MSTAFRQSALLALALCTSSGLLAGPLLLVPFEFQQRATTYNLQSLAGVPISSVSNSPAGSDGRMPPASDPNESGTYNPSTINQFKSLVSFGAIAARTNWIALSTNALLRGTNPFSASVAVARATIAMATARRKTAPEGTAFLRSPVGTALSRLPLSGTPNSRLLTATFGCYFAAAIFLLPLPPAPLASVMKPSKRPPFVLRSSCSRSGLKIAEIRFGKPST